MNYPFFFCPKCGYKEVISMPITEYVAYGHMCKECNTEMTREVESLVCGMSVDKTDTFFRRVN